MMDLQAFQPVLGRKFCVESEYWVKKRQFQRPGAKNYKKTALEKFMFESDAFLICIFLSFLIDSPG